MNQLNQTTQQNASSSEELAATAETLSAQAGNLKMTMEFFKIETALSRAVRSAASHAAPSKAMNRGGPINGSRAGGRSGPKRPALPPPSLRLEAPNEAEFTKF